MSKTFKSAVTTSGDRTLLVSTGIGMSSGFFLELQDKHEGCHPICFNNDTAPALALAILEAAGVEPDREPLECQVSLGTIVADLQETIQYAEALAAAAEAEAQAMLEAEAFNLYRAYMAIHEPMNAIGDWHMLAEHTKEKWLAVARRARELNKEASNGR